MIEDEDFKLKINDINDSFNPLSLIPISNETNLYGQVQAFERLDTLDCSEIKKIVEEPVITLRNIDSIFGEHIDFNRTSDSKFVPTDEAKVRIATILLSVKARVFLLIVGSTSSAKTYSVLMASDIYESTKLFRDRQIVNSNYTNLSSNLSSNPFKNTILRINLSEDSSRDDLLGTIVYDDKTNRFIFKQGAFTQAYENGYWLLLDELSLAPPSVLQAIEAALDTEKLTVQEIGSTREITMNPNFFLVCTTNPNNEEYSRFNLSKEFLDRFHCITYDNMTNKELQNIMTRKCQRYGIDNEIQKIVIAHAKYTGPNGPKCKNMYTLRELDKACILFERNTYYTAEKIIDILYRTRAGEKLEVYKENNIYKDTPGFIPTKNRLIYGQLALDCLRDGFNIILESDSNSGTSYFAETIARKFNPHQSPLIISMTNELHVSDITEFSIPISQENGDRTEMQIKVEKGVIYKAMEEGRVVIINNLERGNTRVIESINDIYECNVLYPNTQNFQRNITINQNFRIIFTMHSNVPHKLSAAFFNRFIHIKMKDKGEIMKHFNCSGNSPINIYLNHFPNANITENLDDLCSKNDIALTTQIVSVFKYTKASVNSHIPLCILGESGYGRSLGMCLMLNSKFNDPSKIHIIYCTSETSIETLIGKYVFEGRLLFHEGPLLQAATKGEIIILKNVDKLSLHTFSCVESILYHMQNDHNELIIPGVDISSYNFSKQFCCLATIDGDDNKEIPRHVLKNFIVKKLPNPCENDYLNICKSICPDYADQKTKFDSLIKCFLSCYELRDIFDTSYRMFSRMLNSIERISNPISPVEQAISIFALFQNAKNKNKQVLISKLTNSLKFNTLEVEKQINSDAYIQDKELIKVPLKFPLHGIENIDLLKAMSKNQLNAIFYLMACQSPIILVGPTSYKETIVKSVMPNNLKIFNATSETTIDDLIGSTSFKKNKPPFGRFNHGDIYDNLIEYLSNNVSTHDSIKKLNLNSPESFSKVKDIIDSMEEGKLKPYFQYIYDIVEHENDYSTFFELGYLSRELLLGNSVLLKNVDQLNQSVVDSLIPFLNEEIDLNEYIPGVTFPFNRSLFFTCSEQKYDNLPLSFKSRVQTVYIAELKKEDIKQYIEDTILLDAYDTKIHDYSDIKRAINTITIASVLNNFDLPEDRIMIANDIIEFKQSSFSNTNNIFGSKEDKTIFSLDELIAYDEINHTLKSLRTGASIFVEDFDISSLNGIVFVPSIACLLDLSIISLATHIPLIVESSPGQNKSTLVRQLGESLHKKIVATNMSKNKTSEYFIGQLTPNENGFSYEIGDLYKYISTDVIYLIDEINLASPSLLSQFLTIFKAPYDTNIAHPRDTGVFLKKFDLFATMNPATLTAGRTYLPHGFLSSSIVYKMPTYSVWDNTIIITSILRQFEAKIEEYEKSVDFIVECHKKCLEQSNDVTIRDMLKLAEGFQNIVSNKDRITKNEIASLVQLIYSSKMINNQEFFEKKINEYKGITAIKPTPKTFTKAQILLIEQMQDALKMNRGIIIRGPSGNGKTYCIKSLAKHYFDSTEHKLYTIQLCAESDISELFGRFEPFYPDNKKKLDKLCDTMINILHSKPDPQISKLIIRYLNELNTTENTLNTVKSMQTEIELMNIHDLSTRIDKYLSKSKKAIQFQYRNSPLIDAMENGHWIVLDNINLCPGDILESLNSLLEETHSLRISVGHEDIIYSMYPQGYKNEKQIHPNFRLIMTSDDRILDASHILPPPFLSRCIVLTIGSPNIYDLPNIAKSYYNGPIFADFFCRCFANKKTNHVRDIIRLTKMYKIFDLNTYRFKPEMSIGKAIKFILDSNYSIPDTYVIPKRDQDDLIKEILSIIQTNLFDNKLDDKAFKPLTKEYIQKAFIELKNMDMLNDFIKFFKATLQLSCFVFSKKSNKEFISLNNNICGKLITFLVCGYFITMDPKKNIPDFIWDLQFRPSIWDLLFIAKEKYDDFTKMDGFIEFLKENKGEEINNFAIEFYQYSEKNISSFDKNKDEFLIIIKKLFNRKDCTTKDEILKEIDQKNIIAIESLPILFPSIPNNQIINNNLSYYDLIQLLNFLEIKKPFNDILGAFNFDINKYEISKDYNYIYNNTDDLKSAYLYNNLLKYNKTYIIIKSINQINKESKNIYDEITAITNRNKTNIDEFINDQEDLMKFCTENKSSITESIIEIIEKMKDMISFAFEQKREKELLNSKQREILDKINRLILLVKNKFIKEEIIQLKNKKSYNEDLWNQIEKLFLLDSRISEDDNRYFIKYNCSFLKTFQIPKDLIDKLKYSVIITIFIVPPLCEKFLLSPSLYEQLKSYIGNREIQDIIDDINQTGLKKTNINYHFLEKILMKSQSSITINDLNSKEKISKIINIMNQFYINTCIVTNDATPKKYVEKIMDAAKPKVIEKEMKELNISNEIINNVLQQYQNNKKEFDDAIDITIEMIKEKIPAIPPADLGQSSFLWEAPFENDSKCLLAHYLTNLEVIKYNIENYHIEDIEFNGKKYRIFNTAALLYNYIYVTFLDDIDDSLASELRYIEYFINVRDPSTPQQMLRRDLIAYLAKINKKTNTNDKNIYKSAVVQLWKANQLLITDIQLHSLYSSNQRVKMIQYNKEKAQYDEFKLRSKNYSKEIEIEKIQNSIKELENKSIKINSEISATFKYLLENEIKGKTKCLDKIKKSKDKGQFVKMIQDLAREYLTLIPKKSSYEGPCYQIKLYGDSFIHKYQTFEEVGYILGFGKGDTYEEQSFDYDPSLCKKNITDFYSLNTAHKNWITLDTNINSLKKKKPDVYDTSFYNLIKDIKKYKDENIEKVCSDIMSCIANIKKNDSILSKYKIQNEPIAPKIDFYNRSEPFRNICDMLMIGYNNGKSQLLNEINYNLGYCYNNSQLKLNIINMTKAKIKTYPQTQVNQKGDSIIISMNLKKEDETIELINNQDDSKIGSLQFKCNFVHPEIYLIFSSPVTVNNGVISIKGPIYKTLIISICSYSTKISHHLQIETINGTEINEKDITINNTNQKISFTFNECGKFMANMQLIFSTINVNISAKIDIDIIPYEHSFVFDANTFCELRQNDKVPNSSYLVAKSPQIPIANGCNIYKIYKDIPYLYLIHYSNQTPIQTFGGTLNLLFGETYYLIPMNQPISPRINEFEQYLQYNPYMYFKHSNGYIMLYEFPNYCHDNYVKLDFENEKLKSISFIVEFNCKKNYYCYGIYISQDNIKNNNLNLLLKQIEKTQGRSFTSKDCYIPWSYIFKLFDRSNQDIIQKCSKNLRCQNNFFIQPNQTYYVMANDQIVKGYDSIPDFTKTKNITQNICSTVNIDTNKYDVLKNVNPSNLFDILANLSVIKSGMQLYRQLYDSNLDAASKISSIYRSLVFLKNNGIMDATLFEVYSIGNKIFNEQNQSRNIEIIQDLYETESTENIIMRHSKKFALNAPVRKQQQIIPKEEKLSLAYNKFNITNTHIIDCKNKTFTQIYKILTDEEIKIKEDNSNNNTLKKKKRKDPSKISIDNNIAAAKIDISKTNFDETAAPKIAYSRSLSKNSKLYELSNIEKDNTNLFLKNENIVEGKLPNLDLYVFKILESLVKSDFSLKIPKSHITLLIDISVLSGKDNKDILALNMLVAMETLNSFGIQFSVWMFADRNLCFCVKKPTDPFNKARETLIRDSYYLNRRNCDSYVLSAVFTACSQSFEKQSSLTLIFSTFVSSQILTPYMKWEEIALNCIYNKKIIGFVEPCQYIDKEIQDRLNESIKESDCSHFIRFKSNIDESITKLILMIFNLSKNDFQKPNNFIEESLDIKYHEFEENSEYDTGIYIVKKTLSTQKSRYINTETIEMKVTNISGDFENIDISQMNFGDLNFSTYYLYPNKATRYELKPKGNIIDINGLINAFFSNFSNMNIFKQKTGEKVRDYIVDIIVDCSTIMRQYSLDHCFLSIISLLAVLKDLEVPCVNLIISGNHIIPFLINQDLRFIPNSDKIYSKLYSILIEDASEARSLGDALEKTISHSFGNSTPHVMFVITDCLYGIDQENIIKDILLFAQVNGTVIGIGTGPTPYRIEEIFTLGVWARNPFTLREALYKLSQTSITKNIFIPYDSLPTPDIPNALPTMNEDSPNSTLLEQFSNTEYINICIYESINLKAFDKSKFTGDYLTDSNFDACKNDMYKGYKILVMMFYEGQPGTPDQYITADVFRKGPPNMKKTKSPGDKFREKGFEYKLVTSYKDAVTELVKGIYSIAMLCTASNGYLKQTEDENYLESYIEAMVKFYESGGALILFGENPPFIFEINEILKSIPNISVRLDENSFDVGGGYMHESKGNNASLGEFLNCEYHFSATIDGLCYNNLPSLGGGIETLFEGKTLAKFINIDNSFHIFSRTNNGNPSCIYKVPSGKEGIIIMDTGSSKLFNEYTEKGAARYINNLAMMCIHCSHFRKTYNNIMNNEGIKINMSINPRRTTRLKVKHALMPLLISIIIDATGSMSSIIETCKQKLTELINECKRKVNEINIYLQFVAYRDFDDKCMCQSHRITRSPDKIKSFMDNEIKAYGGSGNGGENISIGFETTLSQIEKSGKKFKNVFILLGDEKNHDPNCSQSTYKNGRKGGGPSWPTIWKDIDRRMSNLGIDKLITISCGPDFEIQYTYWKKHNCSYINKIIDKNSIKSSTPLEKIFVSHVSDVIEYMYSNK